MVFILTYRTEYICLDPFSLFIEIMYRKDNICKEKVKRGGLLTYYKLIKEICEENRIWSLRFCSFLSLMGQHRFIS